MENLPVSAFSNINPSVLKAQLLSYIPNVVGALFVFICAYFIYRILSTPLKRVLEKSGIENALVNIINSIFKVFVSVFALVMMAGQLGINVAAALAGIGVAGIAIGFASQDALANIIAGFLIFLDKPFRVGDYITHEGRYGCIEEITMRSTRIRTQDNTYVVVPNQKIINDVVIDHSSNGNIRVVVPVNIAYKESIVLARAAILKELSFVKSILKNPAPDVVVDELGDSGVKLLVRVWIEKASIERNTHFKTTEIVKMALDEAGIEIPFPHMQLHIDEISDSVVDKIKGVKGK